MVENHSRLGLKKLSGVDSFLDHFAAFVAYSYNSASRACEFGSGG